MSTTDIPISLIDAYRATDYRVAFDGDELCLRIGEWSSGLTALLDRFDRGTACFITAENSYSRQASVTENAAKQTSLHADLAALGAIILGGVGVSQDASWPAEASYLAIGLSRSNACDLGRKYEQNAIVWVGENVIPELVLLR